MTEASDFLGYKMATITAEPERLVILKWAAVPPRLKEEPRREIELTELHHF